LNLVIRQGWQTTARLDVADTTTLCHRRHNSSTPLLSVVSFCSQDKFSLNIPVVAIPTKLRRNTDWDNHKPKSAPEASQCEQEISHGKIANGDTDPLVHSNKADRQRKKYLRCHKHPTNQTHSSFRPQLVEIVPPIVLIIVEV
jgi:hypothetical protein